MSLNVMVLESEHGAADEARAELVEAGHVVLQCHDRGRPTFPCRGIVDAESCPLNSHTVDLALTVRSRAHLSRHHFQPSIATLTCCNRF